MPPKGAPDQGSHHDGFPGSSLRGAEKITTLWYTAGMDNRIDPASDAGSAATAPSLTVTRGDTVVFSRHGSWLHPLFELEAFLLERRIDATGLTLTDKIIGKAAAMLIVGMGFKTVHGRLMSTPAADFFTAHGVRYTHDTLVERIACRTEELLAEIDEIEPARLMLYGRAGRPVPDRA